MFVAWELWLGWNGSDVFFFQDQGKPAFVHGHGGAIAIARVYHLGSKLGFNITCENDMSNHK